MFIGPVADPRAATDLERHGASVIAVAFSDLPRFSPGSAVSLELATIIADSLRHADLCVFLDSREDLAQQSRWCDQLRPRYVVVDARQGGVRRLRDTVRAASAELVLIGAWLDYDEDPEWTRASLDQLAAEWDPFAFVLTVLPGLRAPARWLREEAGDSEEVASEDIERLLRDYPILVNMDMTPEDVGWVSEHFAAAKGTFVVLGERIDDGGVPTFCNVERADELLSQTRQ